MRQADVWGRAFQFRESLCRGPEVGPRRPPGLERSQRAQAGGRSWAVGTTTKVLRSSFHHETATPVRQSVEE